MKFLGKLASDEAYSKEIHYLLSLSPFCNGDDVTENPLEKREAGVSLWFRCPAPRPPVVHG